MESAAKGVKEVVCLPYGIPIVLTADRTLMSNYANSIFLGFSSCVPAGFVPEYLYFKMFCPPVEVSRDGIVVSSPYGLRKIEAALLSHGFNENEVAVVSPEYLHRVIGPDTRVVGIGETDPLGIGPATTTFRGLFGGIPTMEWKFFEALREIHRSGFKPKIILGGPGAWQLEEEEKRRRLGIDCTVIGEGENVVPQLFEKAFRGEDIPGVVYCDPVPAESIPLIRKPTISGLVEIARGCGRGCRFCTPTLKSFRCLPLDYILKEVEVNVRAGKTSVLLHAEDVLRYKAHGLRVDSEAVLGLFDAVKKYPGVSTVGISHFALSTAASAPDLVENISNILELDDKNWLSGQTGVETGSPRLIKDHMQGKCRPFTPEEWPETVVKTFEMLNENHWIPVGTVIMGLPKETEEDIFDTIHLIRELRSFKSMIVPLFFVAMGSLGEEKSFTINDMKAAHTELLLECWEHNFSWLQRLTNEHRNIRSSLRRNALSLMVNFASIFARQIFQICREDYNNDIQRLINDYNAGKIRKGFLRLTKLIELFQKIGKESKTNASKSSSSLEELYPTL
jgi:radical SAM superfamily enzyme YgiQ (UPF0313 family)